MNIVLPGTAGSTQVCPHPFEQHFWIPVHSWSFEQNSPQIPTVPSGTAGQTPSFSANKKR